MRRALAAALLSLSLASPAAAHPMTYAGLSCGVLAVNDSTGQLGGRTTYEGVYAIAVTASDAPDDGNWHFAGNPVLVSVECWIRVNGVSTGAGFEAQGSGFALSSGQISWAAGPEDLVELCMRREAFDAEGNQQIDTHCEVATRLQMPEPIVEIVCLVAWEVRRLDAALCGPDRVYDLTSQHVTWAVIA